MPPNHRTVAEGLEDVFDVIELMNAIDAGVTIAIVSFSFLGITKHFVGFGRFFEFRDRASSSRLLSGWYLIASFR